MGNSDRKTAAIRKLLDEADCPRTACSRFPAVRVEELLQASNDLSEGDEISYEDARDLALYALDELERVRNVYQSRFMDLANAAVTAMRYPSENADVDAPAHD